MPADAIEHHADLQREVEVVVLKQVAAANHDGVCRRDLVVPSAAKPAQPALKPKADKPSPDDGGRSTEQRENQAPTPAMTSRESLAPRKIDRLHFELASTIRQRGFDTFRKQPVSEIFTVFDVEDDDLHLNSPATLNPGR